MKPRVHYHYISLSKTSLRYRWESKGDKNYVGDEVSAKIKRNVEICAAAVLSLEPNI